MTSLLMPTCRKGYSMRNVVLVDFGIECPNPECKLPAHMCLMCAFEQMSRDRDDLTSPTEFYPEEALEEEPDSENTIETDLRLSFLQEEEEWYISKVSLDIGTEVDVEEFYAEDEEEEDEW